MGEFSEFLRESIFANFDVNIDELKSMFKSIGEWIKDTLEQWKASFKVRHAERRENIVEGFGRFWNGTMWIGTQSWEGAKWMAGKTWNGTKSAAGQLQGWGK